MGKGRSEDWGQQVPIATTSFRLGKPPLYTFALYLRPLPSLLIFALHLRPSCSLSTFLLHLRSTFALYLAFALRLRFITFALHLRFQLSLSTFALHLRSIALHTAAPLLPFLHHYWLRVQTFRHSASLYTFAHCQVRSGYTPASSSVRWA